MKALTIWQPWASLIMIGAKPYEFRRWPAPRALRGREIVVHAGKKRIPASALAGLLQMPLQRLRETLGLVDDRQLAAAMDLLEKLWHRRGDPALLGMGLGTARLGEPQLCSALFAGRMPADDIDPNIWAWPLSDIRSFAMPAPMSGAQGFWDWPGALPEYRAQEDAA